MLRIADLKSAINPLAQHYREFRVNERILLTGHSHQAWPDCSFEAQGQAWRDAAEHVDRKWERAQEKADCVRSGFRRLLGDPNGEIALAGNTHEMVYRLISALDAKKRPQIVTTDSEFHTLRRQLQRFAEEGIEVVVVPQDPFESLAERFADEISDRTSLAALSMVFFNTGRIFDDFGPIVAASQHHGSELLVDMYHALNVVPVEVTTLGLDSAFIVGGGYKYCQLGEGNCFLRIPEGCTLRPVNTGWFAEFSLLNKTPGSQVLYGDGAARFAGATYDPTSHYRAARVFEFFDEQHLDAKRLREISQHQIQRLVELVGSLDLGDRCRIDDVPLRQRAGFLPLRCDGASDLSSRLLEMGVYTDARGDRLRLGPAPYLTDHQLHDAALALGEAVAAID